MDNVYIYFIAMPDGVREFVTPCLDGYTIYIDESLDEIGRAKAYDHAMSHITNNDFEREDVQEIESDRHGKEGR